MRRSILISAVGFLLLLAVVDCGKKEQSASEKAAGEAPQFNEADLVDEPPNPADLLPFSDVYYICNDTLILIREGQWGQMVTILDYDIGSKKVIEMLASSYQPRSDYSFSVSFPEWDFAPVDFVALYDENYKPHLYSARSKESGTKFIGGGDSFAHDFKIPYYGRDVGYGGRTEIAYVSFKGRMLKLASGFAGHLASGYIQPDYQFKPLVVEINKLARITELGELKEEWRPIGTTVIHSFAPATDTLDYLCTTREGLYTLLQDLKMKLVPTDFTFLYALESDSLRAGQVSR